MEDAVGRGEGFSQHGMTLGSWAERRAPCPSSPCEEPVPRTALAHSPSCTPCTEHLQGPQGETASLTPLGFFPQSLPPVLPFRMISLGAPVGTLWPRRC